jgi:two-component system, OmpR family, KDP operon response regulator KdpE
LLFTVQRPLFHAAKPVPSSNPLILIIEDEQPIRRFLRASLSDEGYRLNEASTGAEGLHVAQQPPPDLVVLDLGLPDMDGQEIIRRLREWSRVPIIVLSARDQEAQKIQALDGGADDFVTKPFAIGELLARIRTALRHSVTESIESSIVEFGEVRVDIGARVVYRKGAEVHLTPLEYKLLLTMLKHNGKVLTHRFLLLEVWGPSDTTELHYVRVFVANLRKKLEQDPARPAYFLTEPGVGYRFTSGG